LCKEFGGNLNPIKKLSKTFQVISTGIAGAAAAGLKALLSSPNLNSKISTALSIIAIPIISEGLSIGFQWLFEHNRLLRRILLGGKFVEGTWIEALKKGDEILSVGVVWFENHEYGLKVHGFNYDHAGNVNLHFESKTDLLTIEWPFVSFAHTVSSHYSIKINEGITHIHFSYRGNKPPKTYSASFINAGDGERIGLEGWRLEDKNDLEAIHDPSKLPEVLQKWVAKKELSSSQKRTMQLPINNTAQS